MWGGGGAHIFVELTGSARRHAESMRVKPLDVLLMTVLLATEVPLPHTMHSDALNAQFAAIHAGANSKALRATSRTGSILPSWARCCSVCLKATRSPPPTPLSSASNICATLPRQLLLLVGHYGCQERDEGHGECP